MAKRKKVEKNEEDRTFILIHANTGEVEIHHSMDEVKKCIEDKYEGNEGLAEDVEIIEVIAVVARYDVEVHREIGVNIRKVKM